MNGYSQIFLFYQIFLMRWCESQACTPIKPIPITTLVLSDPKVAKSKVNSKLLFGPDAIEGSGLDYSDFETEIVHAVDDADLVYHHDRPKQLASKTMTINHKTQRVLKENKAGYSCDLNRVHVKITTSLPWQVQNLLKYQETQRKQMLLLDKFTGKLLTRTNYTKSIAFIPASTGNKDQNGTYGEIYDIYDNETECSRIEEFVQKAVMWSTHIEKALLSCRCEAIIEVAKIL